MKFSKFLFLLLPFTFLVSCTSKKEEIPTATTETKQHTRSTNKTDEENITPQKEKIEATTGFEDTFKVIESGEEKEGLSVVGNSD